MEAELTVPPLLSEPCLVSGIGSSTVGLLPPDTFFFLPLAILLGVEAPGELKDQSTEEVRRDALEESLDLYVLLAGRGETLHWRISLDAALDVDPFAKEWEAILKLWAFFLFTDFLEALDEALIQLSSEEQEDVNSFLEATEDRKAHLEVDTMGRILLEIVSLEEAKGDSPVRPW